MLEKVVKLVSVGVFVVICIYKVRLKAFRGLSNIFHICVHGFIALMILMWRISGWMVNNCACSIQNCVLRINRNCESLEASVVFHAIFTQTNRINTCVDSSSFKPYSTLQKEDFLNWTFLER